MCDHNEECCCCKRQRERDKRKTDFDDSLTFAISVVGFTFSLTMAVTGIWMLFFR